MFEIDKGIGLCKKAKQSYVDAEELQAPCDQRGGNKQANVGKHALEITLFSYRRRDQRQNGKGRQENDLAGDALKDVTGFLENFQKTALALLHQNRIEGGTGLLTL